MAECARYTRWLSLGSPISSTNKTDRHDIPEILLKVALNTINQTQISIGVVQSGNHRHLIKCNLSP